VVVTGGAVVVVGGAVVGGAVVGGAVVGGAVIGGAVAGGAVTGAEPPERDDGEAAVVVVGAEAEAGRDTVTTNQMPATP
jgi:hypothetical protein